MITLLLALLPSALADDLKQELVWELSVDGAPVGERRLTLKYVPSDYGNRRILESWTEVDGKVGPIPLSFKERLTAHAGRDPASFHAVQETNGKAREVQAQRNSMGWRVSIAEGGKNRTWELPASRVDLSTADLLDPESRVPLSGFAEVKVLSAETGGVWDGRVERLGFEDLVIDGEEIRVEGLELVTDQGSSRFWYTADGYLVRYEMKVLGQELRAVLADPPPAGPDDQPVEIGGGGIRELEL